MKKNIFIGILCLFMLASCGNPTESSQPSEEPVSSQPQQNNAKYKVNYYLEDESGEYILDSSRTQELEGEVDAIVTVTPATIEGYFCITEGDALKVKVKADGKASVDLSYRKNYTVEVVERNTIYFDGTTTPTSVGDVVKVKKNGVADAVVTLTTENVQDEEANEAGLKVTFEHLEKDYEFNYEFISFTEETAAKTKIDEKKATLTGVRYEPNTDGVYAWNQTFCMTWVGNAGDPTYSMLNVNEINNLFFKYAQDIVANINDAGKVAEIDQAFDAAYLPMYEEFMLDQIAENLKGFYGVLNHGVFEENDGKVTCGTTAEGASYDVYVDPTAELADGDTAHDPRPWIPECYKADKILEYTETLRGTLTNKADIDAKVEKIMIDVVKSAYTVIAEAEMYYAYTVNGHLTVSGDTNASEWWFVWPYESTHFEFTYDGCMPASFFDPTTVTDFRLNGVIFNTQDGAYAGNYLSGALNNCNWVIQHQVDDMFVGIA